MDEAPLPSKQKQDYVVGGVQPWLDGICTEPDVVRQVVFHSLTRILDTDTNNV
jgi:hypothetical protein